jgi:hypothetical protein
VKRYTAGIILVIENEIQSPTKLNVSRRLLTNNHYLHANLNIKLNYSPSLKLTLSSV